MDEKQFYFKYEMGGTIPIGVFNEDELTKRVEPCFIPAVVFMKRYDQIIFTSPKEKVKFEITRIK